ncbi:hypothetical protein RNZ50_26690 [Paracoccaceae bacterium Fryx2]|nr:hypothetical protein [Paracoccaceae bacterium Fryx2]
MTKSQVNNRSTKRGKLRQRASATDDPSVIGTTKKRSEIDSLGNAPCNKQPGDPRRRKATPQNVGHGAKSAARHEQVIDYADPLWRVYRKRLIDCVHLCVFRLMVGIDFTGSWAVISREAGH